MRLQAGAVHSMRLVERDLAVDGEHANSQLLGPLLFSSDRAVFLIFPANLQRHLGARGGRIKTIARFGSRIACQSIPYK